MVENEESVAVPAVDPPAPSKVRKWAPAGVAAALLVASTSAAVYFYVQYNDKNEILDAQESARHAACAYAPTMVNYGFNDLDGYFKSVLDGATGGWKKEFEGTSKELKDVLAQGQVTSKVNDVQCAIRSGDEQSAEAIVVIGQSITSVGTKGEPQAGQLSMVLTLEHTDGRWLVNKVNAPLLPAQQ